MGNERVSMGAHACRRIAPRDRELSSTSLNQRRSATIETSYRKPLTMHEISSCSGGRAACDSASREASMRDETVFRVTNSRCDANPSPDRGFLRAPI